ncbi:hypothetical protein HPB51_020299 [Rhipicephalus microplus]|uniref:Kelch repeat protein n=1 Tax=Rhipicephalus microplus TaxID=6941 RepID=A0A9J6DC06_RHIMP|nr:hypothetical protein HPB51_020299 [Rhipicephalus microplus]
MPHAKSNFAAVVLDGFIYVIGGFNGIRMVQLVERYDIATRRWFTAAELSTNCSASAACVVEDVTNPDVVVCIHSHDSVRQYAQRLPLMINVVDLAVRRFDTIGAEERRELGPLDSIGVLKNATRPATCRRTESRQIRHQKLNVQKRGRGK